MALLHTIRDSYRGIYRDLRERSNTQKSVQSILLHEHRILYVLLSIGTVVGFFLVIIAIVRSQREVVVVPPPPPPRSLYKFPRISTTDSQIQALRERIDPKTSWISRQC